MQMSLPVTERQRMSNEGTVFTTSDNTAEMSHVDADATTCDRTLTNVARGHSFHYE